MCVQACYGLVDIWHGAPCNCEDSSWDVVLGLFDAFAGGGSGIFSGHLDIVHVKAHVGMPWNELVDSLAKGVSYNFRLGYDVILNRWASFRMAEYFRII